jgi:hypothetical protein
VRSSSRISCRRAASTPILEGGWALGLLLAIAWTLASAEPACAQVIGKSKQAGSKGTTPEVPLVIGAGIEFESDGQSREAEYPLVVEYDVTPRLKANLELSYVSIQSKSSDVSSANGVGDFETSLEYEFLSESRLGPALTALGGIKWPTATAPDLGTGETDYTLGLIASKELGDVDVDLGAEYTFVGSPRGVHLGNTFEVSLAAEWELTRLVDLEGEVLYLRGGGATLGNQAGTGAVFPTSSLGGSSTYQFTVGVAEHVNDHLKLEEGVVLEPDGSWQAVVFVEWDFGGRR